VSLNQFSVTDLRPEVELMHLLRMRRTLSSQKPPKTMSRAGNYKKLAAMNSNMTLDFKLEVVLFSKLRMRSVKSPS